MKKEQKIWHIVNSGRFENSGRFKLSSESNDVIVNETVMNTKTGCILGIQRLENGTNGEDFAVHSFNHVRIEGEWWDSDANEFVDNWNTNCT